MKNNKQSSLNSNKTNINLGSEKSVEQKELEKKQMREICKKYSKFSGKSYPNLQWFEF
jgi:hypothetical protein